ncbi:MAG: hypothetical protein KIS63_13210, partial [Caldilineales bacterium]|nr:hypothetical protein [Caldilineales bacterium]
MQQFLDRHPAIYTPWLLGVTACVGIYFALAGMILPGRLPPAWVWASTLLLPLVGLTVQLRVRRVVYIHVFNVICYFAVTAAFGSLLWALLVSEDNTIDKTFTAILVTVSLFLTSLVAFLVDQRRQERATMPTGRQGRLNQRSGIIEDKGYLAPPVEDVTTANQIAQAILKASPL